jgi:hypothetical protein
MEVSANPDRERRKSPRATLTKILYVNLDSGNGGIVLNISEGGLAFHSVAPLMHQGPVRLWFSLSNDNRFEVSGELVWSNQTKKTGGLRFTNLTDSDRAQLRILSGEAAIFSARPTAQPAPVHVGHEVASAAGAVIDPDEPTPQVSAVGVHQPAHSHAFSHSILHAEEPPQPRPAEPRSLQPPPQLKSPGLTPPVLTSETRPPHSDAFKSGYGLPGQARANKSWAAPPPLESSGPSLAKVFVMLIGALVLVAAGVVLYSHSGEVGAALVQLGERLQGRSHGVSQAASQVAQQAAPSSQESGQGTSPQATPQVSSQADAQTSQEQVMERAPSATDAPTPAATDTPTPSENSQTAAPASGISSEKPSERVQAKPPLDAKVASHTSRISPHAAALVPAEKAQSERQASGQAEDSDSATDLDIAEQYLNGVGRSRNSAAAAQFLWAAVAKGNATAELTLAHLYLNGDGVGRSCEQARLLLQAAASKGDVEANEALANLSRERCR